MRVNRIIGTFGLSFAIAGIAGAQAVVTPVPIAERATQTLVIPGSADSSPLPIAKRG